MTAQIPLVLVVNQRADTLALLRSVVEEAGFQALTMNRAAIDDETFRSFLVQHRPEVVIYDVPWPYEENFDTFRKLQQELTDEPIRWMLISTSGAILEAANGIGCLAVTKPFDMDDVMDKVATLAGADASAPPGSAQVGTP